MLLLLSKIIKIPFNLNLIKSFICIPKCKKKSNIIKPNISKSFKYYLKMKALHTSYNLLIKSYNFLKYFMMKKYFMIRRACK